MTLRGWKNIMNTRPGRKPRIRTRAIEQSNFHGAEFTDEELAWMRAVQDWQKATGVKYPSMRDYLAIARAMGYRKVELPNAQV